MPSRGKPEPGHIHKFDKPKETKVLLHDEKEKANNGDSVGGPTVGYDILKQRVCKCGSIDTYDFERTKV